MHQSDLLVSFALFAVLINSQCYYPNGDPSKENDIPCSSSPGSPCCPQGWQCLSNGLCYLSNANYWGRYTCSDQSWKSPSCPNICTHNDTASGNEAILECSAGNYCCDANRPDVGCCDTGAPQFSLQNGNVVSSSPGPSSSAGGSNSQSASTSSSNAAASSSPASSPTSASSVAVFTTQNNQLSSSSPSVSIITTVVTSIVGSSMVTSSQPTTILIGQSSTPSPSSLSSNLGGIIGPAVGVPVFVIALAVLVFFLWRRRRNRRRPMSRSMTPPVDMAQPMYGKPELDSAQATPDMARYSGNTLTQSPRFSDFGGPPELAGNYPRYYDPNRPQAGELPASTYHAYNPNLPRELPA